MADGGRRRLESGGRIWHNAGVRRATNEPAVPALDGRVRRGERSREAIVAALFELIGQGGLQPTAQQVADAAGVGIRSVFRHFTEMESLYQALDARLQVEAVRLFGGERPTGALPARIDALVRQRAGFFERIGPYKRSGNLQRWRSPFLQGRHLRLQQLLHDDLRGWLPELASVPADVREAVDLVTSFEAWERLRADRQLSVRTAGAVVARTLHALLGGSRSKRTARARPRKS